MDMRDFVKGLWKDPLANKQGLYIVAPSGYAGPPLTEYYRCGVAGLQARGADTDVAWGGKVGTFVSRFSMYLNNWIGGGVVHAILHVQSKLKFREGSERRIIIENKALNDARKKYQLRSVSMTQYREALFHRILDETAGVSRVLGQRSEWFHSKSVQTLIGALRKVGGGLELVTFNSQGEASRERVHEGDPVSEERVTPRHSPRVAFLTPQGRKIMRAGGAQAAELTAAIARDARRMDTAAPISSRTRRRQTIV